LPKVIKLTADTPTTFDPFKDGIKMPITGLFEKEVMLSDTIVCERTVKIYIPEAVEAGAYFIVLTVPDGENTIEWLKSSGWMATAEQNNIWLYIMEPKDKKWGNVEQEMTYISQAYSNIFTDRGKHYLTFPTRYLVGYGTGGKALQMFAMKNCITVAAAAFIDASNIDETYLDIMRNTKYEKSDILLSEVPMPVLLISENFFGDIAAVAAYWKKANACVFKPCDFNGGKIFRQKEGSRDQFTPTSCSSVALIKKKCEDYNDTALTNMIYTKFLSRYTRYGGFVGGNTLGIRPNHNALGVEIKKIIVDDRVREYLVYIPQKIRKSTEPAPVLFYFPGSQQTHKMMFDISRMWETADEGNFILIIAQGIADINYDNWPMWDLTKPVEKNYDLKFVEALVKQADKDYNIDSGRRYIGGQSMGGMFSLIAGMNISEYFAAIATTSAFYIESFMGGPLDEKKDATRFEPIPYWTFIGEYDIWPYDFIENQDVKKTLEYWLGRNNAGAIGDYIFKRDGRFLTYEWTNEKNVPMVRYTVTMDRGHSMLPKEISIMWNEWFSKWHKDDNGNIIFLKKEKSEP